MTKTTRANKTHRWLDTSLAYRYLENPEIQRLCLILSNYPQPDWNGSDLTTRSMALEQQISQLPRNLRFRRISLTQWILPTPESGKLCTEHKGLNVYVVASVWGVLRHEIERGVGRFLWPLIMEIGVPPDQELKMRQLEPVLEMFQECFKISAHTPPGRKPLRPTLMDSAGRSVNKWRFQENGCVACMLARIGSDKDVLFALMAGMVGRHPSRVVRPNNQLRSVRVKFVKYWLKNLCGVGMCDDAFDLGIELRRLSTDYKRHKGEGRGNRGFYGKVRTGGALNFRARAPRSDTSPAIGIDISGEFHPGFQRAQRPPTPHPERSLSTLAEFSSGAYGGRRSSSSSFSSRPFIIPKPLNIPGKPYETPPIHDTRRTDYTRHGGHSPIHSEHASIATDSASVLSWETRTDVVHTMSRLSAIPRPLTLRPESAHLTPRASCRSMYSTSTEDGTGGGMDKWFDVSPPDSPSSTPRTSSYWGDREDVSPPDTPRAGLRAGGNHAWERRSNYTNDY